MSDEQATGPLDRSRLDRGDNPRHGRPAAGAGMNSDEIIGGILAGIVVGFIALAVGAAIQRWGDGVKASEHLGKRSKR